MKSTLKLGVAVAVAAVVLGMGALASYPKGKPAPSSPTGGPAEVTLRDDTMDNITSDGGGVYQDGVDQVLASVGTGLSGLTTDSFPRKAGGRSLRLEFMLGDCLTSCTGDQPFLPSSSGLAVTQIQMRPLTTDGTAFTPNGLLGIPVGEERQIAIKLFLRDLLDPNLENVDWTVCFNPASVGDLVGICSLSTDGTAARARRTAQGTWEIFAAGPDASGQRSDAGGLIKGSLGHNPTAAVVGTYSMPFLMTVSCLNEADCPVLPEQ